MPATVTPHLCADGAAVALGFYIAAFGAKERYRYADDGGRIGHAEFEIGDTVLYLSDEWPDMRVLSPATLGDNSVSLSLVEDADAAFARDRCGRAGRASAQGRAVRPRRLAC